MQQSCTSFAQYLMYIVCVFYRWRSDEFGFSLRLHFVRTDLKRPTAWTKFALRRMHDSTIEYVTLWCLSEKLYRFRFATHICVSTTLKMLGRKFSIYLTGNCCAIFILFFSVEWIFNFRWISLNRIDMENKTRSVRIG